MRNGIASSERGDFYLLIRRGNFRLKDFGNEEGLLERQSGFVFTRARADSRREFETLHIRQRSRKVIALHV